MNVKINLTFTIINLFLLPCTSDDYVISVQIGTGKRNIFITFAIYVLYGGNFMKATGIVRRIDDLGRVVIPKEIRRTMRIREGDPLEIYTSNDGEVIFKKYSAINEMSQNASHVADIMFKLAGCPVVVFDRDHVVAVAGVPRKEFSERRVSSSLEEILENRKNYFKVKKEDNSVSPVEGIDRPAVACVPIISTGDVTGAVAFLENGTDNTASELQTNLIQAASQFLGKQVE